MKQRGGAVTGLLAAIGLVVVLMALVFAVCMSSTSATQRRSLGTIQLVNHERDRCYDDCDDDGYGRGGDGGDSGGHQGYGGGGGRSGDNDQRGDHNCRNFCVYVPPPSGGGQQPQSLVPPTPDKIIKGFQTMVDAGINLGTTIARLVTDYVVTVFRFII